jgi:hypothetical protein
MLEKTYKIIYQEKMSKKTPQRNKKASNRPAKELILTLTTPKKGW